MSDAVVPHRSDNHPQAPAGWFRRALDSDILYSFRRSRLTMVAAVITLLFFALAILRHGLRCRTRSIRRSCS